MSLGQRLKELRKEQGLTLQDVSDATGISIITVFHYEKDMTTPSPENIKKLADALKVGYDELYELRRQ